MNLADLPNNAELALFHTGILRQFRALNPASNIATGLQPQFGPSFASVFSPATASFPAFAYSGDISRRVVHLDGVDRATQSQDLINGYNNGGGPTNTNGFNPWMQSAADRVIARINNPAQSLPEWLDLVGYSAGGAIALHVADKLRQRNTLMKLKVISFGAPRAGNEQMRARLSTLSVARWMTDADPVPLVPPKIEDAPLLVPLLGTLTALRYESYSHVDGGISINASGICSPAILPPTAAMQPGTSLATWLLGEENAPNNPHSLAAYGGRLQTTVNAAKSPTDLAEPQGHFEVVEGGHRTQVNRAERQVLDLIANAARQQNVVETSIEKTVLFKAVRLGRIWAVDFGGRIILYAGREDRARHVARAGNDFLRSMPKQAFVDPESIIEQMTAFFNAAVVPGGPSTPPIKITLP